MDENQNMSPDLDGANPTQNEGQQTYTNAQPDQQFQQPNYQQPPFQQPNYPQPVNPPMPYGYNQKSKVAAGILGILLGGLGVHNFYLGFTGKAVAQLLITLVAAPIITLITCGLGAFVACAAPIWGLIEGIIILTSNNPVDANGVPLSN